MSTRAATGRWTCVLCRPCFVQGVLGPLLCAIEECWYMKLELYSLTCTYGKPTVVRVLLCVVTCRCIA